jgi:hypothetical protein
VVALIATCTATACGSVATVGSATTTMGTTVPTSASTRTVAASSPTTVGATPSTASALATTLPATTSPPLSPPANTGAYGYVTAGPTCPVERAEQPCPPRPVIAQIEARNSAGSLVAAGQSDAAGRYSLGLQPGRYTLTVSTAEIFPRCPVVDVTVGEGAPTRADISCDTGIR